MTLMTLLLFIPACFALNMAPGPKHILTSVVSAFMRSSEFSQLPD